jgi:hypothetical protein
MVERTNSAIDLAGRPAAAYNKAMTAADLKPGPARPAHLVLWLTLAAALIVWAGPAAACSCPKEQMIKKYGTVSLLHHGPPLPPPLPPERVAAPAAPG